MHQQELVPRQGRLEGLVQVATLSLQEARKSCLRHTHRPDHKLRGYFPAWTKLTMAVRQAHGQEVIDEVVGHGRLSHYTQPAPQAMFAPLEPLRIWAAIFFEKETGRGREFEKVFVEGGRKGLLMSQYDRRGATNRGHVRVAKLDKLHELADKPLHVSSWMIARLAAHTPSLPRVCGPVLCSCVARLYGMAAESVKRFPRLSAPGVYQDCHVPVYNGNLTTGRCRMFFLLSKFLNWFVYPLSLLFLGLFVILVFYRRRYTRWGL